MDIPALHCLCLPRLIVFGQGIELSTRAGSPMIEFLLRVAAAGPAGGRMPALEEALWPELAPRTRSSRANDCLRSLAVLLGAEAAPIRLEGGRATIDPRRLRVDSIELERAMAPLLVPFTHTVSAEARTAVTAAIARDSVFLPGFDAPWAVNARLRIADALARAARHVASPEWSA